MVVFERFMRLVCMLNILIEMPSMLEEIVKILAKMEKNFSLI